MGRWQYVRAKEVDPTSPEDTKDSKFSKLPSSALLTEDDLRDVAITKEGPDGTLIPSVQAFYATQPKKQLPPEVPCKAIMLLTALPC